MLFLEGGWGQGNAIFIREKSKILKSVVCQPCHGSGDDPPQREQQKRQTAKYSSDFVLCSSNP